MRILTALLAAALAAACASSNSAHPPESRRNEPATPVPGTSLASARTTNAITAADLRTRLFLIAADSMMGRAPGEPGDFKATAYIASEFARFGLKPAGDNGTWFQNLPFYRRA